MMLEFCQLRDRCGLDLADVAAEFGEPMDSVWRWEKGETTPPDRILRSLSIMADFSARSEGAGSDVATVERSPEMPSARRPAERQRKSQLGQFMTPRSPEVLPNSWPRCLIQQHRA